MFIPNCGITLTIIKNETDKTDVLLIEFYSSSLKSVSFNAERKDFLLSGVSLPIFNDLFLSLKTQIVNCG